MAVLVLVLVVVVVLLVSAVVVFVSVVVVAAVVVVAMCGGENLGLARRALLRWSIYTFGSTQTAALSLMKSSSIC